MGTILEFPSADPRSARMPKPGFVYDDAMSEKRWEYCHVRVVTHKDGSGEVTEQIEVVLPGDRVEMKTGHGYGVVAVLNELGADGWEVFEMAPIWLKRKLHASKAGRDTHT